VSQQMPSYLRPVIAYILSLVNKSLIVKQLGGHNTIPGSVLGKHHTSHEDGGSDEISVAGLSGTLADDQPPKAHGHTAAAHDGGQFPLVNLQSTGADADDVPIADGAGGIDWGPQSGGSPDAADVTYAPAVATDWDGDADPGNADDALDQLAERIDDIEGAGYLTAVDAADVTYTPTTAADWDSDADPGDLDEALDQLAERVDDLEAAGGGAMATDPLWDALGDLAYGTGADTATRLAGNTTTTRKFLRQTGAGGGVSAAPDWDTLAAGDYPDMVGANGGAGTKGAVPAPAAGDSAAGRYLRADGTWAIPSGTGAPAEGSAGSRVYAYRTFK
jgi:hypothetical protein